MPTSGILSRSTLPTEFGSSWSNRAFCSTTTKVAVIALFAARETPVVTGVLNHRCPISTSLFCAESARVCLCRHSGKSICFYFGDGALGWAEAVPFGRIIVTATFLQRPDILLNQMTEDSICIAPVGPVGGTRIKNGSASIP